MDRIKNRGKVNRFLNQISKHSDKIILINKIAERLKVDPKELIDLFFSVGLVVINQTTDLLEKELKEKLKYLYPGTFQELTDDDYKKLLEMFKKVVGVK